MGCCTSSPYARRRYRDPADLDEEVVPYRYFGTFRSGSNLVPDDVAGLPSTHILGRHLATDTGIMLYQAEIDHGKAYRRCRFVTCCYLNPITWPWLCTEGLATVLAGLSCDEICCWVRKEYHTRTFFRVYSNRIQVNTPMVRIPYGCLGCGSWNGDHILNHPFDRGAFGFSRVPSLTKFQLLGCWPVYGGVVARHRCQCFGPLWNRMFTDCGGWWCDEWPCLLWFCSYHYDGIVDPGEAAFACSIALQAYFEGRTITTDDMNKCLTFWRENISEERNPITRKRSVCCEPYCVPCCTGTNFYKHTHPVREIPFPPESSTDALKEAYGHYEERRVQQTERYESLYGPLYVSTACRVFGCKRCYGRKGCCFCTEGCEHCDRPAGAPAPHMEIEPDWDDVWDASAVLRHVIGPPPPNVVIRQWRWDIDKKQYVLFVYPDGHEQPK